MQSTSSIDVNDTLSTIESYAKLASDPGGRHLLLADETCIQFLAYVLEKDQPSEVVQSALQVLSFLSEKSEHCHILSKIYGVSEALECLMNEDSDFITASTAKDTLERLLLARRLNLSSGSNRSDETVPLRQSFQPNRQDGNSLTRSFFKSGLGAFKSVVLQIHGLATKDDRRCCEESLIKVGGVISLTFDMNKKRCILRTKSELPVELLVGAISQTKTMTARHVIKTVDGQDVFANAGNLTTNGSKENVTANNLPEYLPENDGSPAKSDANRRALTIFGSEIGRTTQSWFSSATNFVNKSFYW